MQLLHTREQLDAWRYEQGGARQTVGLVPTMGALHDGHLSHIRHAKENADRVVVSIFVNPTQFGPNEDFERYPRDLERDAALCEQHGADAIFVPEVEVMYPPSLPKTCEAQLTMPGVAAELEGAQRPGHFAGVCRVVMKLFGLVRPDVATFGRKDYQQLTVIKAMVADLMVPVRVVEVPTTREPDGLAMSSRNVYLDADQRERALGLIAALRACKESVAGGERGVAALEEGLQATLAGHEVDAVDYAVVRDAETLGPAADGFDPAGAVALLACRFGATRLIDNLALG